MLNLERTCMHYNSRLNIQPNGSTNRGLIKRICEYSRKNARLGCEQWDPSLLCLSHSTIVVYHSRCLRISGTEWKQSTDRYPRPRSRIGLSFCK